MAQICFRIEHSRYNFKAISDTVSVDTNRQNPFYDLHSEERTSSHHSEEDLCLGLFNISISKLYLCQTTSVTALKIEALQTSWSRSPQPVGLLCSGHVF
jgi:hypothetical protein